MTVVLIPCRWCGRACRTRRGGSPRLFCTSACRTAFHSAARRWAEQAVASGILSIDALRSGDAAPCTLLTDGNSPFPAREEIGIEAASLDEHLGHIFDALTPEELGALSEPVWALLEHLVDLGTGATVVRAA